MNINHTIRWLFTICWLGLPLLITGQTITDLKPSSLPYGSYIKGLYTIEIDVATGEYLKELPSGVFTTSPLDTENEDFYFWIVENDLTKTFQIYSGSQRNKLISITQSGELVSISNNQANTTKLLFRLYPEGPKRTDKEKDSGVVAMGYITTVALSSGYGNIDCKCNIATVNTDIRFKVHNLGIRATDYSPIVFQKTDNNNTSGTVVIDNNTNVTRIHQPDTNLLQNYVSSNFFVKGFGADDFKVTIAPGTEGTIGFVNYTRHHFTRNVYAKAKPEIGIKIKNNQIILFYLSGKQDLPLSQTPLGRETSTNFVVGVPIVFGFDGQDKFTATQNGKTFVLKDATLTELFFNQSITQSAKMLVQLKKGFIELGYTSKNYLINSEDNFGSDSGDELASTFSFFPYNKGNSLINTFDWQQTKWAVRYHGNNRSVETSVFSPFYKNHRAFSGISAQFDATGIYQGGEDFVSSEGWELIKANLGYNADGSIRNQAPPHPYLIFYDRVASRLRVFVYTNNQGEANQLTMSLEARGGTPNTPQQYIPRLWGSLQQFSSLDKVQPSRYSKANPFMSAAGREWYFSDFVMEYDPCINFFESYIELKVHKTTQGNLTMVGRLEGGSIPAGTPEYGNWQNQGDNFLMGVMDNSFGSLQNTLGDVTFNQQEQFDLINFGNEISGVLEGAAIPDWEKEAARLQWEGNDLIGNGLISAGAIKMVEGTAKFFDFGVPGLDWFSNAAQGAANIAEGASVIVQGDGYKKVGSAYKLEYNYLNDRVKHDDQNINLTMPPPRPQVVFGELALKGTLSIETDLINNEEFIATPGGLNSENAPEWYSNGSRASAPLYNQPMGKFAVLHQPEFGIGIVKGQNATFGAYLKINEKPYIARNNMVLGKIEDVLSISIQCQTLNTSGQVVSNSTSEAYSILFGIEDSNSLPGEMDITNLIDWGQIYSNIEGLNNQNENIVRDNLANWIKISYQVWSLSLTNLKSRDLNRVFANANQYYNGNSMFAYTNKDNLNIYQLKDEAQVLTENEFSSYIFSDDSLFGKEYHLYHSDYNDIGDKFFDVMNTYCNTQTGSQSIRIKIEEEIIPEVSKAGLTVFPNPTHDYLSYSLLSKKSGRIKLILSDLNGRVLLSITDSLDKSRTSNGRINIQSLRTGLYILKVELPDGEVVTKKIVKK
ncbi:T9SS type A sorting domain-containing protein [Aquimarina sediminis]|uniref:T9SS type A sorting domain-containing protein n=1 Tax=Aquimarina sediminis TaxID=2070536 RepID=UPI000CA08B66|nr:T9SS type A sorting domain-containing protein [Aquimarina sediminis]